MDYTRNVAGLWDYPGSLPFRLVMADGMTRTNPATFKLEEIAAAGYVAAPARPDYDGDTQSLEWDDVEGAWRVDLIPPPPPASPAEVDAERDRRIAAGFVYQGVDYQTRPGDYLNFGGASTAALAAILDGAQPSDLYWAKQFDPVTGAPLPFAWIATDDSRVPFDAQGMIALGSAAMAHRSAFTFRGNAIKARIRAGEAVGDVTADALWT